MTTVKLTGNFLATARCLIFSDGGGVSWNFNQNTNTLTASATSGGTFLSSVGLAETSTAPIYTVTNSPLTANGTLDITLNTQAANLIFSGPTTGAAAQPTFRSLVAADIPVLAYVTSIGSSNLTIGGTAAVPTVNLSTAQVTNIGLGGTALQSVSVIDSITGNGTGGSPLQLLGDAASPGNSFYYGTNGSGTRGWYASLASAAASASVGLSAVVGSGTAYMLANAAPALDVTIVPTWTGAHTFTATAAITIKGDSVLFTVKNSTPTNVLQIGTVKAYTGAGSTTDAAVVATGSLRLFASASGSSSIDISGSTRGVTINAPSSGDALLVTNVAGGNALVLAGNSAGTAVLRLNTQATTGAQTATFTATNKPGTGTTGPDKWIPINLDGTTHYIPAFL